MVVVGARWWSGHRAVVVLHHHLDPPATVKPRAYSDATPPNRVAVALDRCGISMDCCHEFCFF